MTDIATQRSAQSEIEHFINGKAQLRGALTSKGSIDLFDGSVTYVAGDELEVTIPKQLGVDKAVSQIFSLDDELSIKLLITSGGLLRGKHTVRIHRGHGGS